MEFKRCIWKNGPTDKVEYSELKTGSRFVSLRSDKEVEKKTILTQGPDYGKTQDITKVRDILVIQYPHEDVQSFEVKANKRQDYWLVVNHTKKTARPVLKVNFDRFYSKGVGGKVQGDRGVMPPEMGKTDKSADERLKKQNADKSRRK